MAQRGWEVGPVLKQKLGSQGTLFRGGSKYSSDRRFPRGYNPQRLAEVRDAVRPTTWKEEYPLDAHLQRTRITDTLARSTVPVSHLEGLQWAHVRPGEHITPGDTAGGAYFESRPVHPESRTAQMQGVARSPATIAVKPGLDRTSTVVHEVGHHVSRLQDTEHGANYSYETAHGGQEEAYADNYAEQHYRDRQGRPQFRGIYGGGQYAGRIQRSDAFWHGYGSHRDWSLNRENVAAANEEYFRKYPEEKVHPDRTVDEPLIEKDTYGGVSEARINPEALPDWSAKYVHH